MRGKPYYEDEAVAALISMRPLGEVLDTVLVDRGGAPLHFVLTHAVFWVETTGDALRWLSVIAAMASVPLCFDLARRLAGTSAGVVAAAVAASSTALAVYGSFGRMYALFVLVSALFADLYVRARQVRTTRAVAAAAAAGWLLPAVHPYGVIPAVVAMVGAATTWSRRPLRAAWPVALAVLAAVPFLFADLRLADRAAVGSEGSRVASVGEAWGELVAAVSSFAGGDGIPLLFFTVFALAGLVRLGRDQPAVVALAASVVVPPVVVLLVRTESAPDLSPRHLFYGLPLWAAAIGVACARFPPPAVAIVALIAVTSPASALRDPREVDFATAAPGDAPTIRGGTGDVLVPYSTVFLAALPDVRQALALPHGPADEVADVLGHADEPIAAVHLAVPTRPWTVRRLTGPFDKAAALEAVCEALSSYRAPALAEWRAWLAPGVCSAARSYTAAPWQANESRSKSSSATRAARPIPAASAARG